MIRKVLIYTLGTILIMPIAFAICSESTLIAGLGIVYAIVLWHSPKFSKSVQNFWLKFWKVCKELESTIIPEKYDN